MAKLYRQICCPARAACSPVELEKEVKAEARKLKVDRYVKKPFDLAKMLKEIDELLCLDEKPDQ